MPKRIERDEVRRLSAEGAQVVEVLGRSQYDWAHLPGAQHIWLPKLDEQAPARLTRDRPVVVYCNDYAGQDPINGYDLDGKCIICSNPLGLVSDAKKVGHGIGRGAKWLAGGAAYDYHFFLKNKHAIGCSALAIGVVLSMVAGAGESYEAWQGLREGKALRQALRGSKIVRLNGWGGAAGVIIGAPGCFSK